jgi:hypothetical protein
MAAPFLTSVIGGGEWSASCPLPLYLQGESPGTHWIGGWVCLRAGADAAEKRKILHRRESSPARLACSPSLYRLSYFVR